MKCSKKKWIRKHGPWGLLTATSLAAVVLLGATSVRSGPGSRPREDAGLRFVCVGDVAVDLWREGSRDDREWKRELPFAEARRKCRPPGIPGIHGAVPVAAAVAPVSGYGLSLDNVALGPMETLSRASERLKAAGWSETPGSRLLRERTDRFHAASFTRNGAWLLTLALGRSDGSGGSRLLMAGQWPELEEELK